MLASDNQILELIPQRPPVVMIDKLLQSGNNRTVSALTITSQNLFFENGHLSESGLVENIAQTAAAGVGYVCKIENRKVPVGFIASIKDLKIIALPPAGVEIITEAEITNTVMGVSILHGRVKLDGNILAECEMRIFVKE
jgi:3-hydroxyacyl-[acyl-carrier-protein] dehydratase